MSLVRNMARGLAGTCLIVGSCLMATMFVWAEQATPPVSRVLHVDRERGEADHPGSSDEPFETIGQAAAVARPGDRIEIAAGEYNESLNVENSGTKDAPILVAAAPDADVRIVDNVVTITADFVTLEGLTVESADDDDRGGIFITGGRGITLRDITARENEGAGVRIKPIVAPVLDLAVVGGSFSDNDGAGLAATGELELSGLTIESLTAHDNNGDGLQIERASAVSVVDSATTNNGEGDDRNGLFLKQTNGAQVDGLRTHGNGHNGVALRQVSDVTISRTISTENGHHGFDSIEDSRNVAFINNVSYANGDKEEDKGLYVTDSTGVTILNNVFAANAGDQLAFSDEAGAVQDITSNHNLFWQEDNQRLIRWFGEYHSELAPYQASSGQDNASIAIEPGFANPDERDFALLPGSPAIDAGTVVKGINDTFVGAAPDLGAIERIATRRRGVGMPARSLR